MHGCRCPWWTARVVEAQQVLGRRDGWHGPDLGNLAAAMSRGILRAKGAEPDLSSDFCGQRRLRRSRLCLRQGREILDLPIERSGGQFLDLLLGHRSDEELWLSRGNRSRQQQARDA